MEKIKDKSLLGQGKTFWKGFYFGVMFIVIIIDLIYFGVIIWLD